MSNHINEDRPPNEGVRRKKTAKRANRAAPLSNYVEAGQQAKTVDPKRCNNHNEKQINTVDHQTHRHEESRKGDRNLVENLALDQSDLPMFESSSSESPIIFGSKKSLSPSSPDDDDDRKDDKAQNLIANDCVSPKASQTRSSPIKESFSGYFSSRQASGTKASTSENSMESGPGQSLESTSQFQEMKKSPSPTPDERGPPRASSKKSSTREESSSALFIQQPILKPKTFRSPFDIPLPCPGRSEQRTISIAPQDKNNPLSNGTIANLYGDEDCYDNQSSSSEATISDDLFKSDSPESTDETLTAHLQSAGSMPCNKSEEVANVKQEPRQATAPNASGPEHPRKRGRPPGSGRKEIVFYDYKTEEKADLCHSCLVMLERYQQDGIIVLKRSDPMAFGSEQLVSDPNAANRQTCENRPQLSPGETNRRVASAGPKTSKPYDFEEVLRTLVPSANPSNSCPQYLTGPPSYDARWEFFVRPPQEKGVVTAYTGFGDKSPRSLKRILNHEYNPSIVFLVELSVAETLNVEDNYFWVNFDVLRQMRPHHIHIDYIRSIFLFDRRKWSYLTRFAQNNGEEAILRTYVTDEMVLGYKKFSQLRHKEYVRRAKINSDRRFKAARKFS